MSGGGISSLSRSFSSLLFSFSFPEEKDEDEEAEEGSPFAGRAPPPPPSFLSCAAPAVEFPFTVLEYSGGGTKLKAGGFPEEPLEPVAFPELSLNPEGGGGGGEVDEVEAPPESP